MTDPQPRWLPAADAARYLGMETEGFRRAVRRGILPGATYKLGAQSPRWDRSALDRAMGADDTISGLEDSINAVAREKQGETENRPQR